ncbi:ribose-5-phosphate isomerase A [Streptomyces sp. NPDC058683]|uniref:ribose-5-phosphate isomerase A n=1 Tax=Streptomyces sp. NPDC058683 TaxID=3346597 RepID=UPI00366918C4
MSRHRRGPREAALILDLRVEPFGGIDRFDVTIDGADQVAPDCWLVKGGGAAHTRESGALHLDARHRARSTYVWVDGRRDGSWVSRCGGRTSRRTSEAGRCLFYLGVSLAEAGIGAV